MQQLLSLLTVLGFLNYLIQYAYPQPVLVNELLLFTSAGLLIIFIKHIEPLKEIISNKKNKAMINRKTFIVTIVVITNFIFSIILLPKLKTSE
ncbi:MAG: hypothetical protein MZV64_45855 [Ignavibacteriales bacterium]|nr:hypothetical protein [Ignavibacteriales bacterium]